jgi:molybdate transport system ATP-binding protein
MLLLEAGTRLGAFDLDLQIEVAAGSCTALAGPSGAGKTSALRIAAGLLRPDRGRVACGDATWLDTAAGIDLPPEHRGVGFVFQDYALFPNLSAWRNVAYGMDAPRGERRAPALELLDRFGMAPLADARPGTLSGGERQRVALARALARNPRALLLDEPLTALDARTRASARRELGSVIAAADVPVLIVTHDFEEAAVLADQIAIVDGGRVLQVGTASELSASPGSAFVAELTGAVVMSGTARAEGGLTAVDLDGGGRVTSTDGGSGPVSVSVHPWEVTLEPRASEQAGSARNRLPVTVVSVARFGNRVRVGLEGPQPMVADLTEPAARSLAPGTELTAVWKATATRIVAR